MSRLSKIFQTVLWNSRFLAMIAVVASLVGAIAMFLIAGKDAANVVKLVVAYLATDDHGLRARILARVAEFIDGLLFGAVLLIFTLGIYELFIGRIEAAESNELAQKLLLVRDVEGLKDRLAKVIFLILIVRYFEFALDAEVRTAADLLSLAAGIALIALSLYLTAPKPEKPPK
jgi:uncharacterized membrane protein YqhA